MTIPFDPKELEVVKIEPATARTPEREIYNYPVSQRDAVIALYEHKPVWQVTCFEITSFNPRTIPDNWARGMIREKMPFDKATMAGGLDMFGVNWVYVPVAGGSMEDDSQPFILEDANDWRECIKFPDVDSWGWEECAKDIGDWLDNGTFNQTTLFTGWFERLISFMGFEEAALALIDEDQEDALKELFLALSDCYNDIIDHVIEYFPLVDGFCTHDDWGSQAAPFFSFDTCRELIVPAMKKVVDHVHSKGRYIELHSCGNHGLVQMPNIIEAGYDAWCPQLMNDIDTLWREYGDKILLPPLLPAEYSPDLPEEEQIRLADEYVEKYCTTPGRPSWINFNQRGLITPAFGKELYKKSREAYAAWPED